MDDPGWDEGRFAREAPLLALFGVLVWLVLGAPLSTRVLGTGAILGVCYWTVLYHEGFAGVRERFPGGERIAPLWSFVVVALVAEFPAGGDATKGALALGFAGGVCCAGLVRALRARVNARVQTE